MTWGTKPIHFPVALKKHGSSARSEPEFGCEFPVLETLDHYAGGTPSKLNKFRKVRLVQSVFTRYFLVRNPAVIV